MRQFLNDNKRTNLHVGGLMLDASAGEESAASAAPQTKAVVDIIVRANNEPCYTQDHLDKLLSSGKAGKSVAFTVLQCRMRERNPLQATHTSDDRRDKLLSAVVHTWETDKWEQLILRDQYELT
jgi:hypothetical protein